MRGALRHGAGTTRRRWRRMIQGIFAASEARGEVQAQQSAPRHGGAAFSLPTDAGARLAGAGTGQRAACPPAAGGADPATVGEALCLHPHGVMSG